VKETPLLSTWRRVCETPAPTFHEEARADLVSEILTHLGFEVVRDEVGNVWTDLPGGSGPRVALVAHLDSVFAMDVDVSVREEAADRWAAPGIGDNAASVAVLLELARLVHEDPTLARPRVTLAFTVGEEGLGDLRGARHFVQSHGRTIDAFLAVDGHLGSVVDAGVGSRRFRIDVQGPGGHAWGDYPSPSAVHALGDMIHAVSRVPLAEAHRSSINVAEVSGGTAINAIAAAAWATVDLRSVSQDALEQLDAEARKRVRSVARRHEVEVTFEALGDRPAGACQDDALVSVVRDALVALDVPVRRGASSTDANAAMSSGIPALCLGVYRGGDAHRLSEWADPTSMADGVALIVGVLARLAEPDAPLD